ncbi:PLAC8-like protein 1 [Vipera latastei]
MDKFISCCFTTSEKKSLYDRTQSLLILPLPVSGDWNSYLSMLGSKNSAEPVTIQPCPTGTFATSNMTTLLHTGGNWSTGLFDICSDKTICLCGLLCSPCLECRLASKYGECFCFPLLLGSTLALRAGIRERYSIHGTLCEDWMAVHCCWPCAICQMAREMRMRPLLQVYKMHQSPPPPPLLAKDALV